jgi:hypothetical protein
MTNFASLSGKPISGSSVDAAFAQTVGNSSGSAANLTLANVGGTEAAIFQPTGAQVSATEYKNYGQYASATLNGISLLYSGANNRGFWTSPTYGYGNVYAHHAWLLTDALDNGTSDGTNGRPSNGINTVSMLYLEHQVGGSTTTGVRETLSIRTIFTAPSASHNVNDNYLALRPNIIVLSGDNGAAGSEKGAFFAMNPCAFALPGAAHLLEVAGEEINTAIYAGASALFRYGSSAVCLGDIQGSLADAAFAAGSFGSVAWHDQFLVSDLHGGSPCDPTGSIIRAASLAGHTLAVDRLMDFSGVGCNYILKAPLTVLSPAGWQLTAPNFGMEVGSLTMANTPYFDLHSSGAGNDYDVRIAASGGSATVGQGALSLMAAAGVRVTGTVYPATDNAISLGNASNRWSTVFAGTGTINTSDERAKADIADPDTALLNAVDAIEIKQFKYLAAVSRKGAAAARTHIGVIAQQVWHALSAQGIDPTTFSFWCRDYLTEEVDQTVTIEVDATTTETYQATEDVDNGDHIVRQAVTKTRVVPLTDKIPVIDADGNPIVIPARGARVSLDASGQPVLDPATGHAVMLPAVPAMPQYVLRPQRVSQTSTTKITQPLIDPATGKQAYILGVRPTDLLFAMMLATRRRIVALGGVATPAPASPATPPA